MACRRPIACLRDHPCRRHRVAVRIVPGASRLEGAVAGRTEGGEPGQRGRALAAPQLARGRAGIVGPCRARWRAAVHPQLRQPGSLQPWIRDRLNDDHALLHGRRTLSRRRRQDASGRGHHSPGRGAPGRRVGLFVQPDSDFYVHVLARCVLLMQIIEKELEYLLQQSDATTLILCESFKGTSYLDIVRAVCPEIIHSEKGNILSEKFPHFKRVIVMSDNEYKGMYSWPELLAHADEVSDETLAERIKVTS